MKSDAAPPSVPDNDLQRRRGFQGYESFARLAWLRERLVVLPVQINGHGTLFLGELGAKTAKWAGKKLANSARWPKTSRLFSNELRRVVLLLFMHGISIRFLRNRHKCLIVIAKAGVSASSTRRT